jgi:hypothetical protein
MITLAEYNALLNKISKRVDSLADYASYMNFEKDWEDYYRRIFTIHHQKDKPVRIFIAESCPDGTYPNPNYIFNAGSIHHIINSKRDMYLTRYFKGIFPRISITSMTKEECLIELAKENILILDLLPTHGIKLFTKDRIKIRTHLLGLLSLHKIIPLGGVEIHYAFSVPPSLYTPLMLAGHLGARSVEFGNVNSGQGHAPSITAIRAIVARGF